MSPASPVLDSDRPGLTIDAYRAGDEAGILACIRASFGGDAFEARWRHLHLANPVGPSVIVLARSDDTIIGQIASLRRRLRFFGKQHTIAHVVDTMVHPSWQRRGVLREIVPVSEASVEREGLHASYGVANEVAVHAAVTYERRQPLGSFPLLVRPLRPLSTFGALCRHYLAIGAREEHAIPECAAAGPLGKPPSAPVLTDLGAVGWDAPRFDERHTRLFARAADLPPISFARDAEHLAWRYPTTSDGLYAQRDVVEGGDVVATAIVRLVTVAGLRLMFVMEWHWQQGSAEAGRALGTEVLGLARRAGAHGVGAMAARGSAPRRVLQSLGFLAVPARAVPQQTYPGINPRGPLASDPRWTIGSNWHFTWGDSLVL